jgi:hypothetical protein
VPALDGRLQWHPPLLPRFRQLNNIRCIRFLSRGGLDTRTTEYNQTQAKNSIQIIQATTVVESCFHKFTLLPAEKKVNAPRDFNMERLYRRYGHVKYKGSDPLSDLI